MSFHPYRALKQMPAHQQTAIIGIIAWLSVALTLGIIARSPIEGLKVGLQFLLPLIVAFIITYRWLVRSFMQNFITQTNWPHPKTAALTAGVFIAFVTVVIMFLLYMGQMFLVRHGFELLRPYDLMGIEKATQDFGASLYFVVLGPMFGAWAWIPLGILQGCLLMPKINS